MPRCQVCKKELGENEGFVITIESVSGSCTMSSRQSHSDIVGLREIGPVLYCLAHGECFVELIKKVKDGTLKVEEKKSGCFIATAAYGSSLAIQVEAFRDFRDRILIPTGWGRSLIRLYERFSPPVAGMIEKNNIIRWLIRQILGLLLRFIGKNGH